MTENVTLTDGTVVQCRPVPPHAALAIYAEYGIPQPPSIPMKQVQSKAGHTEPLPIAPGDEGWEEFNTARNQWHVEYQRIMDEINQRENEFALDFSIIAWKRPSDSEWQTDVPESWEFPSVLERHEIAPSKNKRLDFIKYELLQTKNDLDAIQRVLTEGMRPMTREEVNASRGKFRAEAETGRRGTGSAGGEGQRDADIQHDVLSGDAGGKGVGSLARRLVRTITRK